MEEVERETLEEYIEKNKDLLDCGNSFDENGERKQERKHMASLWKYAPDWIKKVDVLNRDDYISWLTKQHYCNNYKTSVCTCNLGVVWIKNNNDGGVCPNCGGWVPEDEIKFIDVMPPNEHPRWLRFDKEMYYEMDNLSREDNLKYANFQYSHWGRWNRLKLFWYIEQDGYCNHCGKHCRVEEMQLDHKIAKCKGGIESIGNLQMLCVPCHRKTSNYGGRALH